MLILIRRAPALPLFCCWSHCPAWKGARGKNPDLGFMAQTCPESPSTFCPKWEPSGHLAGLCPFFISPASASSGLKGISTPLTPRDGTWRLQAEPPRLEGDWCGVPLWGELVARRKTAAPEPEMTLCQQGTILWSYGNLFRVLT